ncbi:MAG: hypothetical protein QW292_13155, partial [Candidatus Parvarchaeota archaeon]
TINTFINELRDFGITSILIGMDRGFYGSDNMMEFKDYGVIGAIASTVSTRDELIMDSKDVENSRNYFSMKMRLYS